MDWDAVARCSSTPSWARLTGPCRVGVEGDPVFFLWRPNSTASGPARARSSWHSPCPFPVRRTIAINVSGAVHARAVVRFAVAVAAAVVAAVAAMALAAAMVRLHDVSSLLRVPTLE